MDKKFKYSYSAPTEEERAEIESIRREYGGGSAEEKQSDLAKLRKLDGAVKKPPKAAAAATAAAGTLVFGLGMTTALEWENLVAGIITGAAGAAIILLCFPLYRFMLARRKKKYAAEILEIAQRLLKDDKKD